MPRRRTKQKARRNDELVRDIRCNIEFIMVYLINFLFIYD